jgi:hypothetical protein
MRNVLLWLAIGMLGAAVPAAADSLTVKNCTGQSIAFKVYNEGDIVCWVPRYAVNLANCSSNTYQCDGKCKVEPMGPDCRNFGQLNGSWTVMNTISLDGSYGGTPSIRQDAHGKYWLTTAGAYCTC